MIWTTALQLLQDVCYLQPLSRGLDGFEVSLLADGLAARGWEVQVCCQGCKCTHCKTGWSGRGCCNNLHHPLPKVPRRTGKALLDIEFEGCRPLHEASHPLFVLGLLLYLSRQSQTVPQKTYKHSRLHLLCKCRTGTTCSVQCWEG